MEKESDLQRSRLGLLIEISKLTLKHLRTMPTHEQIKQRRKVDEFVHGHVGRSAGKATPLTQLAEIGEYAKALLENYNGQVYALSESEVAELRWVVTGEGAKAVGALLPMFKFEARQVLTAQGKRLKRCECGELFDGGPKPWALYCSDRCSKRNEMRRYRERQG